MSLNQKKKEMYLMKTLNAKIEYTELGTMGYGYMSFVLGLKYEGSSQGFGTYDLRFYGIELIEKILETVGVSSWESLKGQGVRVVKEGGWGSTVEKIGHLYEDRWLDMKEEAERRKPK